MTRTPIPEGSRVRIELTGTVDYDDGATDQVRVRLSASYTSIGVERDAIISVIPPVQRIGASMWDRINDEMLVVVMHDPEAGCYVLRTPRGALVVCPDDGNLQPAEAWAAEAEAKIQAAAPTPPELFEYSTDVTLQNGNVL